MSFILAVLFILLIFAGVIEYDSQPLARVMSFILAVLFILLIFAGVIGYDWRKQNKQNK